MIPAQFLSQQQQNALGYIEQPRSLDLVVATTRSATSTKTATYTRLEGVKTQMRRMLRRTTDIDDKALTLLEHGLDRRYIVRFSVYGYEGSLVRAELRMNVSWPTLDGSVSAGQTLIYLDEDVSHDITIDGSEYTRLFKRFVDRYGLRTEWRVQLRSDILSDRDRYRSVCAELNLLVDRPPIVWVPSTPTFEELDDDYMLGVDIYSGFESGLVRGDDVAGRKKGSITLPAWFDAVLTADVKAVAAVGTVLPDALEALLPELADLCGDAWADLGPLLRSYLTVEPGATRMEPASVLRIFGGFPAAQTRLAEVVDAFMARGRGTKWSKLELMNEEGSRHGSRPPSASPRHVNVWLARPATASAIPKGTRLATSAGYLIRVGIGPLAKESVVLGAPAFPIHHLPLNDDGHWLEVVVVSFEFVVPERRHPVFLPHAGPAWVCQCTPGNRHTCSEATRLPLLDIPIIAPDEPGVGRIRVAVYFEKNLVQTLLITAEVAAEEAAIAGIAITAVVDFSLTSGLTRLGELPPRSLNILTNDDPKGTHTIVFNGEQNDVLALRLTEGQMTDAIVAARASLREIHLEEYKGGFGRHRQMRNRYDSRNAKGRKDFEEDLRRLAPLGRALWDALLTDKPERRRQLRQTLLAEPAVIQVGRTGGSSFVFPWALIYDIPLETGNPNAWKTCPAIAAWNLNADPQSGEELTRCPAEEGHALNTICPFGFWGFHHQIEAPAAVAEGRTLATAITVDTPPPQVVVAVSTNLDRALTSSHLQKLGTALADFDIHSTDTRAALATRLEAAELELVYFYCHGWRQDVGGAEPQPYIELGDGEVLAPGDLGAWFEAVWPDDHWIATAPLVFINGCHTAEITPRTLVQFVDAFAGVYAAGVIGTETTVHQQVAGEVAEEFWARLRRGATVGEALQAARVRLLRKGNLMGLAYTAYCSVDLRLVGMSPF